MIIDYQLDGNQVDEGYGHSKGNWEIKKIKITTKPDG